MYWITGILGFALGIAPFVLSYDNNPAALWTSIVLGAAVMVLSIVEGIAADKERWEYWTAAGIGIVAIFAPFIIGFSGHVAATWTTIVAGILIAFVAGSKLSRGHIGT